MACDDADEQPKRMAQSSFAAPAGSAAAWRALAMRLADESTAVLDNAHWEVKHGSGDLLTTIKAVREKYRLETQMPPNVKAQAQPPESDRGRSK
jgi:hypothetical protein